ncbi:galactose oxidase [Rhizophagus irregularis]|uniref:Galactose oxidase n=1 Tax=Rhizophagus irregularis TaxID=588596 RepID=A0A2I1GPI4_9GLOM|nr:galactose oxidase [Rhizophagus irregularis]
MLKNSLVNFTLLWLLLQVVLVEVNCQMTPFKPSALNCHTATFIDNKLYILSGLIKPSPKSYKSVKEFFYLDVSVPFNTRELSWQDLSNINMVPPHGLATSAKGGVNNDTLFLYGGSNQTMESVYTFDPHHMIWNPPKITGISTIRKSSLTGVMGYNGKFYLWGGRTPIILNDMLILDTISLNWEKGSLVNAPTPRIFYGATLLPNDKIIYIGGLDDVTTEFDDDTLNIDKGIALSLNEVYLYDMINDNWDVKITTGKIPSNRCGFSSVLGLDGQRVIIYGGVFNNPGYLDTTLYVLDLTNYNWYIPKISGIIPKPRVFHQANVIEKYMVISFGIGYDRTVESDILLLDISNNEEYVWTTSFDPSPSPSSTSHSLPTSSQTSNNSSDNSKMVGAIVGSLLSGIFLSVGGFFLYKWNKKRQSQNNINNYNNYGQEKAVPADGSKNENMTNHEVVSAIVNNDNYYGQEVIITPTNNDGFKFFKFLNKK